MPLKRNSSGAFQPSASGICVENDTEVYDESSLLQSEPFSGVGYCLKECSSEGYSTVVDVFPCSKICKGGVHL